MTIELPEISVDEISAAELRKAKFELGQEIARLVTDFERTFGYEVTALIPTRSDLSVEDMTLKNSVDVLVELDF